MADTNKYVDTAFTGGGNNGTQANPYTSLSSWDSNEAGTVNSGDRHIVNFKSDSSGDTNDLVIGTDWTVNGEIIIQQWSGGSYFLLKPSAAQAGHAIEIQVDNVTIDGLDIDMSDMNGSSEEGIRTTRDTTIKNCYIHDGTTSSMDGIYLGWADSNTATITIENCRFFNLDRQALNIQNSNNKTVNLINNTCYNIKCKASNRAAFGHDGGYANTGSDILAVNNVGHFDNANLGRVFGAGTSGGYHANSDYNVSSDGTATMMFGDSGTKNWSNVTFTDSTCNSGNACFTDITGAVVDLHIQDSANNVLKGKGIGPDDETVGSYIPTTDFDGDTRSGSTCDIGADEIASVSEDVEISGDMQAENATVDGEATSQGTVTANGNAQAQTATVNGEGTAQGERTADGHLQAQNATVNGDVDIQEPAQETVNASGNLQAQAATATGEATAQGTVSVDGHAQAQAATVSGDVDIFDILVTASGSLAAQTAQMAADIQVSTTITGAGAVSVQNAETAGDISVSSPDDWARVAQDSDGWTRIDQEANGWT